MSLIASILEQHAPAARVGASGPPAAVRPDLLIADRETLRMPLGQFARHGAARPAIEVLVASDRPGAPGAGASDPAWGAFATLARECGLRFAPPRAGDRAALALETCAAPGRLFAALGAAPESGALGALALPVGELEALALLAEGVLDLDSVPSRRIDFLGELPGRCDGTDVAGALLAAHPGGFAGTRVECAGDALLTLSILDRAAICRALVSAGALAVVFPGDDLAREWLRARGREADWRRTECGPAREGSWVFDLAWTVPHAISCTQPARAVPVEWWSQAEVAAVEVGPGLTIESLARFAAMLRGRPIAAGTTLSVRPWTGLDAGAPEALPARRSVEAARGRWLGEGALGPRARGDARLRLFSGEGPAKEEARRDDWCVGLLAAAEAACAGRIESPHHWHDPHDLEAPPVLSRAPVLPPAPAARTAAGANGGSPRRARAPRSPGLRGPVLGRLEGDLDDEALLPYGPRLAERLADPASLAEHVMPAARLADRAAGADGGWLLVLGEVRGIERREAGLLALGALGVRGVLAAGFDARARSRFARAGLLALRALRASDMDAIELGDELELVGGLDTWVPDRARVVRDLTRAFALVALPDLTAREWDWVVAGGSAC